MCHGHRDEYDAENPNLHEEIIPADEYARCQCAKCEPKSGAMYASANPYVSKYSCILRYRRSIPLSRVEAITLEEEMPCVDRHNSITEYDPDEQRMIKTISHQNPATVHRIMSDAYTDPDDSNEESNHIQRRSLCDHTHRRIRKPARRNSR